jgi:hypothetical protein
VRFAPDLIVLRDIGPTHPCGRASGEVMALPRAVLLTAGQASSHITAGGAGQAAGTLLLQQALPADMLVLPSHEADVRERIVPRPREG